jgi:site-specific DNA recombinase
MGIETAKGNGGKYRYYNCSVFTRQGKSACPGNRVRQDELEPRVLEHLSQRVFSLERIKGLVQQLAKELGKLRKANAERIRSVETQLNDVRFRIAKNHDAIESGAVDMSLVGDRLRQLKAEEADLLEQLERARGPRQIPPYLFKEDSLSPPCQYE